MQIELQMVGVHRTADITIKDIFFKKGRAVVEGADERVGNICRYLEAHGAWQTHIAEQKQAILDGEGDLLGIRAARRKKEKAEELIKEANEQILVATELVEEKLQAEAKEEQEAARVATLAAKEREAAAKEHQEVLDGKLEDHSAPKGRSGKSSGSKKGPSNIDKEFDK